MYLNIDNTELSDQGLSFMFDVTVRLDGINVQDCTEAAEEQGYIVRYARDKNGDLIIDVFGNCEKEKVYGDVYILHGASK